MDQICFFKVRISSLFPLSQNEMLFGDSSNRRVEVRVNGVNFQGSNFMAAFSSDPTCMYQTTGHVLEWIWQFKWDGIGLEI